jgi:hypothetical protein
VTLPSKPPRFSPKARRVSFYVVCLVAALLFAIWHRSELDEAANSQRAERSAVGNGNLPPVDVGTQGSTDVKSRVSPAIGSIDDTHLSSNESRRAPSVAGGGAPNASPAESAKHTKAVDSLLPSGADSAGVPFPISQSVKASCEQISHLGKASCADIHAALDRLQKESRDFAWAGEMERIIDELVAVHPGFSVRSLVCRTTVCAVEVESTQRVFLPDKRSLRGKLIWIDQNFGYEVNEGGERVKVTLVALQRESR